MLLDTSGLFSALDRTDEHHAAASNFLKTARNPVTHSYILAELVPLCRARGVDRKLALGFTRELMRQPGLRLVWVTESLHSAALGLLEKRLDKTYSLADAVSFVIMKRFRIRGALTTDRHFEQEGFVRLLKPG